MHQPESHPTPHPTHQPTPHPRPHSARDFESIYHVARQKQTPSEREAYLDAACGGDQDARDRVEALLRAADDADTGFLQPEDAGDAAVGTTIDNYKLLQKIGEGGFGVVYMAEQKEPVRRKVALKIIKRGMDTEQVIARFEAERQALAMMDHPNIAMVLDGGQTPEGRPYFVMELVRGESLQEFCDEQKLSTGERLELFIQVCHAVQHAHQKGVIHRDLKPSNVLVTLHDGKPVPKVIDFGIAKAIHQPLTEKTLFTEYRQMIGTPEYMAPEQAEMSGLDVDTRADVYSLGVLLYELLTGANPFADLRERGVLEMLRVIREDDPPKPSTRLSRLGDTATDVAMRRSTQPKQLDRLVKGDLDWIVMKALEKDRARRYETASSLAEDILRHLGDQPVDAGPPSRAYRLQKFVRRNRVSVFAGLAVIAALVIGLTFAILGQLEAERAREQIATEASNTRALATFYERMFGSLNPNQAGPTRFYGGEPGPAGFADLTVTQLLQRAEPEIDKTFRTRPELQAELHRTFAWTYGGLGQVKDGLLQMRRAYQLQQSTLGAQHPGTLLTERLLAFMVFLSRNPREAAEIVRKNAASYARLNGDLHVTTLDSRRFLGTMLLHSGQLEEADRVTRDVVESAKRELGENHEITLWAKMTAGIIRFRTGHLLEGARLLGEIQEDTTRTFAGHAVATMIPFVMRGIALAEAGRYEDAEAAMAKSKERITRLFGARHMWMQHVRSIEAIILRGRGEFEAAERLLREVADTQERTLGLGHHITLHTQVRLVAVEIENGKQHVADQRCRKILDLVLEAFGESSRMHVLVRCQMGRSMLASGRLAEAESSLRSTLQDAERILPSGFLEMPELRAAYGICLGRLDRRTEAEPHLVRAYEAMREARGSQHRLVVALATEIAKFYDSWKMPEKAAAWRAK